MIRKLIKFVAYSRAPKATFALLHPIRALKWGAVYYVGRKIYQRIQGASEQGADLPAGGAPSRR